jgi:hypothetical protein
MAEGTYEDQRTAKPARRVARERLGKGKAYDPVTGEALPDIPTLIEVERRILLVDEQLAEAVEEYSKISELAAAAKAAWEEHRDLTIVEIVNTGDKGAKDTRSALAKDRISREGVPGEDLYRVHLITEAALESKGKHLYALQARLSALQTLCRGLRQVTGLDP